VLTRLIKNQRIFFFFVVSTTHTTKQSNNNNKPKCFEVELRLYMHLIDNETSTTLHVATIHILSVVVIVKNKFHTTHNTHTFRFSVLFALEYPLIVDVSIRASPVTS
jgi:hypothetical protein